MHSFVSTIRNRHRSPPPKRDAYPRWKALSWFALLRLCLAAALNLALLAPLAGLWSRSTDDPLTVWVSIAYLLLVLIAATLTYLRRANKEHLVQSGVFIDIVAFTLLMHGSGGVQSGFGLLLAITVAAGALLMEGRLSLLFASFATLGVITEQTHSLIAGTGSPSGFPRAGLLGVTYFTVAILAHVLYRRIRETETLAESRQVDIADLSKLNEFIIRRMGTGVLVLDEQRRVRLINTAARQLLGVSAAVNRSPLTQAAPQLAAWLRTRIGEDRGSAGADIVLIEEREIQPTCVLLGDGPSGAILVFLRDKRELIQEAQQIKLASLGRLTASIAHNIRNPLSAVKHAGQLLAESPALAEEDLRLTEIISRNTGRIDDIVESVLQLSRRNQAKPLAIDLGTWAREFGAELRESRGLPQERMLIEIAADTPSIEADPRHLHQIVSILCDNAILHGATPERPASLGLRTGGAVPHAPHGPAFLEVRNDGPGIEPEVAREMFTPFFTTSVGGTGLGLYIALELCETNAIDLTYAPLETGGSCFRLTLPGVLGRR